MDIHVTSSAFAEGENIPTRYTCDGANISPPLSWTGIPPETQSYVLICEDPDAPRGTWTHWLLWNIPADTNELPEHLSPRPMLEDGAHQGMNDANTIGYSGPCPPQGPAHRYFFIVSALDCPLELSSQVSKDQLFEAMKGHVLSVGRLMGRYARA